MTIDEIKNLIQANIPNSTVHVLDPLNDGLHLEALVISPVFEGVMLVKQHQMVMFLFKDALKNDVHALGLKTFTPALWEKQKNNFQLNT